MHSTDNPRSIETKKQQIELLNAAQHRVMYSKPEYVLGVLKVFFNITNLLMT